MIKNWILGSHPSDLVDLFSPTNHSFSKHSGYFYWKSKPIQSVIKDINRYIDRFHEEFFMNGNDDFLSLGNIWNVMKYFD